MSIYDDHTEVNQFNIIFATMNLKMLMYNNKYQYWYKQSSWNRGGVNFWKEPTKVSFERCTRNQSTVPVSLEINVAKITWIFTLSQTST